MAKQRVKTERAEKEEKELLSRGGWMENMAEGIKIDKNDLDTEVVQLPDLFYQISERLALTVSQRDAAKEEVKIVESEVDEVIRAEAAEAERKVTEGSIKAAITAHRDVITVKRALSILESQVLQLSALRDAYSKKADMLKLMTSLYASGYFITGTASNVKSAQYDDNRDRLNKERVRRSGKE
jgi:uncharacterized protein (DUF1778 family)